MSDDITNAEIEQTASLIRDAEQVEQLTRFAFDRDLQIRSSERGLGLVWEGDGETWAIVPDPFYTKEFLFGIKAMCNRVRRLSRPAGGGAKP